MSSLVPAAIGALVKGEIGNALVASTPGGIEAQEAAGQQDVAGGEMVPRIIRGATKKELTKLGFEFLGELDEIFHKAKLPKGWSIRPTSHSMHSDLIDSKGSVRAAIFYKAAFYDRRATMTMVHRFVSRIDYSNPSVRRFQIWDNKKNEMVTLIGTADFNDHEKQDKLDKKCGDWLKLNKPDHNDAMAYW